MEFKGTPGPWKAIDSTDIVDSNGFSHVEVTNLAVLADWDEKGFTHWSSSEKAYRKIPHEEQMANACLIAAAPELLGALTGLLDSYKQLTDSSDAGFWKLEDTTEGRAAMKAINKALGG
ncbi:hypothetical protein [Morganella morganii]|uniref:hypothetical protein n=1 Tax=Morganella morganii TaxID=582 RepID=UPI001C439F45|nr:hypothetical protein [Morganella morganii]QXO64410.1 hypothetical protein JC825_13580 [Morganella morganii]